MKFLFVDCMGVPDYNGEIPYIKGLGGTQSAICYYAEYIAKLQHDVTVVNINRTVETTVRGVQWKPLKWLMTQPHAVDVYIWCSGISKETITKLQNFINAKISYCWIPHNTHELSMYEIKDVLYAFDKFAFVSEWQRKKYIETFNIPMEKTCLMMNGVSPAFIGDFEIAHKKPIFLYISEPTRGLNIVADGWTQIVESYPQAELHVYSSRKLYGVQDDTTTETLFKRLKSMQNVAVNIPVGQDALATICREAAFFAYPANISETGCIVLTEACAAGCLPIVSNLGAPGTYFDNALIFDDTIVDQFVKRAKEYLAMFYNTPMDFCRNSEKLAYSFQTTRDYANIVQKYIKDCENLIQIKQDADCTYKKAMDVFEKKQHALACTIFNTIPHYFKNKEYATQFFLNVGVSHFYCEHYNVAIEYFEKALAILENSQLYINLFLCYEKLKNPDKMLEYAEKSLKYGINMIVMGKLIDTVMKRPYFERNKWASYFLNLYNNDLTSSHWQGLYMSYGNLQASDHMLIMRHDESHALTNQILSKMLAHFDLYKFDMKKNTEQRLNLERLFDNLLLGMNYFETRNKELYKYAKFYNESLPKLDLGFAFKFPKIRKQRQLRVGFITGDLTHHPVSYVLNGILEHLTCESFVFSDANVLEDSILQNRMRTYAKHWVELKHLSIPDAIKKVADCDIDVLVEMCGHTTHGARIQNIVRAKPCRVLVNYFAYPNTYGYSEMDYKIGDSVVFPPGLEAYYYEGFCKIAGGFHTYKPIVPVAVNRKPHTGIVFGCTNNPKKYRPNWIKCVVKILKAVPDSKLKLRYFNLDDPSIREFYCKEFEKHGIERGRLDIGLGENFHKYFETYNDIDIILDPYPYNGGTINIETLYMGIPYVTLLGNNYVSRVGASILHQAGHPELIAKNEDEYVGIATKLATTPELLQTYHATLRDTTMKTTLMDNKAFTRKLEEAFVWMLSEKKWYI